MIDIDIFELQILSKIKKDHLKVKMIPIDIYYSLLAYCEEREDYFSCIKLRDIEDRISPTTMLEYFDTFVSK